MEKGHNFKIIVAELLVLVVIVKIIIVTIYSKFQVNI